MVEDEIRDALVELKKQREQIDEAITLLTAKLEQLQDERRNQQIYNTTPVSMFRYRLDSGSVHIERFLGFGDETTLIVPDNIGGFPVTHIDKMAFAGLSFETAVLPDSVIWIGESAFRNCRKLKDFRFSSSLRIIGKAAFFGTALEKAVFPDSLCSIGAEAFYSCKGLREIQFGKQIKELGRSCFAGTGIHIVRIPGTIRRIPDYCFSDCESLERVILNAGTTQLGDSAFGGKVRKVIIPETISDINLKAFTGAAGRYSLEPVELAVQGWKTVFSKPDSFFPYQTVIVYCRPGSMMQQQARALGMIVKPLNEFKPYL